MLVCLCMKWCVVPIWDGYSCFIKSVDVFEAEYKKKKKSRRGYSTLIILHKSKLVIDYYPHSPLRFPFFHFSLPKDAKADYKIRLHFMGIFSLYSFQQSSCPADRFIFFYLTHPDRFPNSEILGKNYHHNGFLWLSMSGLDMGLSM